MATAPPTELRRELYFLQITGLASPYSIYWYSPFFIIITVLVGVISLLGVGSYFRLLFTYYGEPINRRRAAPIWKEGLIDSTQNHVGASSNTNTTIASTTDLDLLPPFPKSERATVTEIPPPEFEECVGILPVVPAKGNLSNGTAFELMVITRLERLEAGQNRIEAAILAKVNRLAAWLMEVDNDPAHYERIMAEAAEARQKADLCEGAARCILESLKNGTSFEESMAWKLFRSDHP
ncbi:hypothetical protein DL766_003384 [Monosporascus sp. MC13-8B]|uniref:Uncharacterized protein n=1 Tax=Monosporascus cannonballus TaxID=155416 RepID=A0ABY0H247_9PEZI|nr:hypothetical protein DL762_006386 [Monosporascus cannonballus]RYO89061.1 hypothetical protein DL763_005771 [Monosporascus cannonballus]RYP33548.1 hypothetical protein DL766_003384 [Monosporascus sp. MC13-8B]